MPRNPVPFRVMRQKPLRAGFQIKSQTGSHVKFTKEGASRRITVIVPYSRGDIKPGTVGSILKQAELTWEEFLTL